MDYIVTLLFILIATLLIYKYKIHTKKYNKRVFVISFVIVVILFCACRQVIPNIQNCDAYGYLQFYKMASNYPFVQYLVMTNWSEFLFYGFFWVCAKYSLSYTVVRIIYYLVMCLLLFGILNQLDLSKNRYSDFWILITNFVLSYCLMRNCLGYFVGWYAILLFHKEKNFKSILVACFGFFVHNSCIIVLAYIIFALIIKQIKKMSFLFAIMLTCYAIILFALPELLSYFGESNAKIAYYLNGGVGSFAVVTNVARILILFLLLGLFYGKKRIYQDSNYRKIIVLTLFSLSIIFAQLVNGIAYRFLTYFDILNLLAFGYIRGIQHDRKILIGPRRVESIVIPAINIVVLFMFLSQSLTGYGLIPVKWF